MNVKLKIGLLLMLMVIISACGGPRINSKPQPYNDYGPMLEVSDAHIRVKLNQLMFRNSRGSWAKDANWDEYLLSLETSQAVGTLVIEQVAVRDVMGDLHLLETTRKTLNRATRTVKKKYKKAGYKITWLCTIDMFHISDVYQSLSYQQVFSGVLWNRCR